MPFSPPIELVKMIEPPSPPAISAGMAAFAVWKTPVRLTSIMSCHCSVDSSHALP